MTSKYWRLMADKDRAMARMLNARNTKTRETAVADYDRLKVEVEAEAVAFYASDAGKAELEDDRKLWDALRQQRLGNEQMINDLDTQNARKAQGGRK